MPLSPDEAAAAMAVTRHKLRQITEPRGDLRIGRFARRSWYHPDTLRDWAERHEDRG